ncbi:pyrimidine-nucleoside phosphorylase [Geosporobacter subterraneus DSM 17957]|uniref:Pyrimidine-nucleoside phosphorylase n=1 Tax=Geosporobacter subterraneus DSM 17957 TaxID=1121919 RepID=A0A1M6C6J8_9FIRM|nr:pyrimidine-nucleoside phosphorylase [Geosporobacter subterraneus]SHI56421.1 pyrimidine-nucleoside phosphorylase [Geosporobacter subterraneus DSM 17957]
MRMYDIIYKKRQGLSLSKEEIEFFVKGYTEGSIPDYQASALMMAIYFNKMSKEETFYLTDAMMRSGDQIDLSQIEGIKVDKHSTGGVGDTTTLIVGPLVAACGVPVAKMSGRGLGHTGGTIDKLESIRGFHVEISSEEFFRNVNEIKLAVIGQSGDLAPADKKLYALRDVTATVDNISLIASSIMSKKLAAGANAILLDVKVGSGAFMKDFENAASLALEMVEIGSTMGRETIAVLTDMDQPLGNAVGNSLEVLEAIHVLHNRGPEDLRALCIKLASYMVLLARKTNTLSEAEAMVVEKLESGAALEKFKAFIQAQGGELAVIDNPQLLPQAKYKKNVLAAMDGYIEAVKADDVGLAALNLGAGRETKDSVIDLAAGVMMLKKVGDPVSMGDVIAELYTNDESKLESAMGILNSAIAYTDQKVEKPKLIKAVVTKKGIQEL